jgi:hypothetical protein
VAEFTKAVEEFVAAMEASAKAPLKPRTDDERSGVVTDPERIRSFMAKALQNRSTMK